MNAAASQITKVSLPDQSMFIDTPVYRQDDGTVVFGLRQPPLLAANGDVAVTVDATNANRLDLVSQSLYGTPGWWWTIADVTNLLDPLAGVPDGTLLRAPLASRLPS